ncbi:SpvB/TcaC N-terminal domain-containing protein [Micromonospora palythoicola]|uniref:SpvB/TcaC N-terminal domain-containing protein n=1 Tax=Micromonospora palythoicola TaxID=3120507 RepID=UPI002FCDF353
MATRDRHDAQPPTTTVRPAVALPTPGGAIRGLGEKFAANPVTGSASLTVPLGATAGRSGFGPDLAIGYDSAAGQSAFGYGWQLDLPTVSRQTERGVPRYRDDTDVFVLSGADDLVPAPDTVVVRDGYRIQRYRPRIDSGDARIERWSSIADRTDVRWRVISADNVTSWYGRDQASRIADPTEPDRIFSWLLCQRHDDRGNVMVFEYQAEDSSGVDAHRVDEHHRTDAGRGVNRYLKRVRYGNETPYHPGDGAELPTAWHFDLVLDYGADGDEAWPVRADPWSSYRAGFEVRTYRLCRRALMYHRFPSLGNTAQLVASTDFGHQVRDGYTFLATVTRRGYDGTASGELPPLSMSYQQGVVDPVAHEVTGLPYGFDETTRFWVDLAGEGAAGLLARHRGAWWYARNLSPSTGRARFAAPRSTTARPSGDTGLLLDLDGSGAPDLVRLTCTGSVVARRADDGAWRGAEPLTAAPVPAGDPAGARLHLADLTGDGLPDLVAENASGARWYACLGRDGFAAAMALVDGATGAPLPRFTSGEGTELVQFADMTGDGLPDLVRVGNGAVRYRPNLGHGRFGAWVRMADAPWLDGPGQFDPRRVLLGDVDGTGPVDLVYLAADATRLYGNRSGNGFAPARTLTGVPTPDRVTGAALIDLLGVGTACLVWSTPPPAGGRTPLRYLDLMGGVKPHLLIGYDNGLGAQVRIEYRPSTAFYLEDEARGRPWATRLPFPVQCAYRVTTTDRVRETVFVRRTSYHDGCYDPREREFRGFGLVETQDTESYDSFAGAANASDPSLHQPPVLTRSWYHTGSLAGEGLLHTRRAQYFVNPEWAEHRLAEPVLPAGLTDDEYAEAVRALKGLPLRTEVYALDGSAREDLPYTATEWSYQIRRVRPRVFRVAPAEAVRYGYDRVPADPRVEHMLVLELDDLGLVRRSASVVYPRQRVDPALPEPVRVAQARRHVTYTEHDHTADVSTADAHRLRVVHDSRGYELAGLDAPAGFLSRADLLAAVAGAPRVPYEQLDGDGVRLRLLARWRVDFLADDLSGPLPAGTMQSLGLVHRVYRLALTDGLVAAGYDGAVSAADLTAAGYLPGDGGWWLPSGTDVLPADAREHFYLPAGHRDPFGLVTTVERDHDLLPRRITDPLGHQTSARNDFRVLAPDLVTDVNGNHRAVRYDPLGVVVASAAAGQDGEGDTLADPTATVEYDLFRQPARLVVRHREQHGAANPRWQERHVHLDGTGAALTTKTQAPPGPARSVDPETGLAVEVDTGTELRWIGTGRTIVDNRGAPVKQYQPYFSTTPDHESEAVLVETGVTPVIRYDPVGRMIRVDAADGTFTRFEHGAWLTREHDANDTVLDSLWYGERGSPSTADPEPADPHRRAAWLAAAHAGTATERHLDGLGREVLASADNGADGPVRSRSEADLAGHVVTAFDARDRPVATVVTDLLGRAVRAHGAERGTRWMLTDVAGTPVRVWDDAGRVFATGFDAFRRPTTTTCTHPGGQAVVGRVVYGDAHPEGARRNLLGLAHVVYDAAGSVTLERADFRGRPVELTRRFTHDIHSPVDWSGDPDALLEPAGHTASARYDAVDRVTEATLADGTVLSPGYDVANRLVALTATGHGSTHTFLVGESYDAQGRRLSVELGNGAVTRYAYHPRSLRLTGVTTTAQGGGRLQDLAFFHDPVGNVTEIVDGAQQTHFFANAVVRPDTRFTYDALYRLVRASGREHAGLDQTDHTDPVPVALPHLNDATAVRRYHQLYRYDDLGNLTEVRHVADGGGWTRRYRYAYDADPADLTNRLLATSLPGDLPGTFSASYGHDARGNMVTMPHLASLSWDVFDRLAGADLGGGGTVQTAYGAGGDRVRKVVQRQGGLRTERRYLGPVELYREWMNGTLRRQRWTLHVSDGQGRLAQVDTTTVGDGPVGVAVVRYRYSNHLGSSMLETDADGVPISYEEYHPFGTTAYRSSRPSAHHSLARYRYTDGERDEETGLYQLGARYYAAWLGRWTSPDPAGFVDGPNLYAYCRNNPVTLADPTGTNGGRRRLPYEYPELNSAMAADPGSFRDTGEVAATHGRSGTELRWRVLQHDTFGRVWQYAGAVTGPYHTVVWGGPPLIRESDALARWSDARVGPPAPQPQEGGDLTGPPGPAEPTPPEADSAGGGGDEPAPEAGPGTEAGTGQEPGEAPGRSGGQGAVTMWDTHQRRQYMQGNRAASDAAQRSIAQSVAEGNTDDAMRTAQEVSEARNARRLATQSRLSPGSRALSQVIEGERSFASMLRTYLNRLPGVEGGRPVPSPGPGETARRIAVAAGESRGSLKVLTRIGRVAGPVGLAFGAVFGIHAVATAPEGQRGRVAAREIGAFVGGAIGASVGMSAGVALAGGISGFLIGLGVISGPIGWLAIGLGLLGAGLVGWWWSRRGGQLGEAIYDWW